MRRESASIISSKVYPFVVSISFLRWCKIYTVHIIHSVLNPNKRLYYTIFTVQKNVKYKQKETFIDGTLSEQ